MRCSCKPLYHKSSAVTTASNPIYYTCLKFFGLAPRAALGFYFKKSAPIPRVPPTNK